jgi:hypothetical protein
MLSLISGGGGKSSTSFIPSSPASFRIDLSPRMKLYVNKQKKHKGKNKNLYKSAVRLLIDISPSITQCHVITNYLSKPEAEFGGK